MSNPKRNFAPMPLAVLASDATPQEKLFILALYHHDWDGLKAWPTMGRISRMTSISVRALRDARTRLEGRGWIVVDPRTGRSNSYTLNIEDMSFDQFNAEMNPGGSRRGKDATPAAPAATPAAPADPLRIEPSIKPTVLNTSERTKLLNAQAGILLNAFKTTWEAFFPGAKYIRGHGDHRQARDWVAQGVNAEDVTTRVSKWLSIADDYTRDRNCPFWLFARAYNSIRINGPAPDAKSSGPRMVAL